jgi:hypothetical protein
MTLEQRLITTLGEKEFTIARLTTALEVANARIKELSDKVAAATAASAPSEAPPAS